MIYICNTTTHFEATTPPYLGITEDALSYDTDALNSIAGALNTLAKESVSHFCGAPIFVPKLEPRALKRLQQPSKRRDRTGLVPSEPTS
mgnify:CR=1 FL=1